MIKVEWMNRMSRKLIILFFVLLGALLIGFIVNSSKLVIVRGERDRLSETELKLVENQLGDTAKFLSKLANGPSGPGDNELSDLVWLNKQALLIKHSGIYSDYDESPGFRKAGFRFSEALDELQLALYNLDSRMTKYHYKVNDEDRKRARDLSKAVYELEQKVITLREAAYGTSAKAIEALNAYKSKADIVTKQSRDFIEVLKKE